MQVIKNKLKIRWFCGCLIFFALSCKQSAEPKIFTVNSLQQNKNLQANLIQINLVKKLVKSGDIITRTGNDFTSQSLKKLNRRDKTFSHCGIASMENDSLFVYHALGGEWNPDEKIKRELFENFADPANNNILGIYRFKIREPVKSRIIKKAQLFYNSEVRFDMDFDLVTDEKMYCAEFIYKVFLQASDSAIKFNHSFIKDFEFIGVDDIITDPSCKKIAVLNYKL